jgi:hypothetical protein
MGEKTYVLGRGLSSLEVFSTRTGIRAVFLCV